MKDYYEYSTPELVEMLGQRFRDYRLRSALTQLEVSGQAGVAVGTIHKFEHGKAANVSLGTFLALLRAIGCLEQLDELLPELPESAYLVRDGKKVQRIRHKSL
jgi:transcriptional regulator with XRE-family HTH domain